MPAPTKKVWIRLSPKVLKRLAAMAKRLRRSRASVMAEALEEYATKPDPAFLHEEER